MMQFNVCSNCKADNGRCGTMIDGLCMNCFDTKETKRFTIHSHLFRTSEELAKTGELLGKKKMTVVKRETLVRKIKDTKGQIFSVRFVKMDGNVRDMNCRLGVKKFLTGTGRSRGHLPHLINVYDLQVQGYRYVNKNTIQSAVINGVAYTL